MAVCKASREEAAADAMEMVRDEDGECGEDGEVVVERCERGRLRGRRRTNEVVGVVQVLRLRGDTGIVGSGRGRREGRRLGAGRM